MVPGGKIARGEDPPRGTPLGEIPKGLGEIGLVTSVVAGVP